jgi:UDP-3-O-[3-hydroxymyristoyl] glucosamine N-acyltransferase
MIHPTAIVSPKAKIGTNVFIGPFTIVHQNVVIGSNSNIGSHCEIGVNTPLAFDECLVIGESSLIRSHSVLYMGSSFGAQLTTGHRVTVREKTKAGRNLQIGTLSDIQGHCEIGDFVRFHSNVHIGQHSKIGNYVWIFPYVVLTNDPHPPSNVTLGVTIEDYVAIATMSVILPGAVLKSGALIAAHSSISKTVDSDTVVGGSPAKFICKTDQIKLKDGSNLSAYPWRQHFHRGYPDDVVSQWLKEFRK